MSFCPNCGCSLEPSSKFCRNCGAAVAEPSIPAVPVAPAVVAPVPQVYNAPVSTGAKVQGYVGMGLAIGGLFFAIIGLLYTFIGLVAEGLAFAFAIAFSFFSMPLSIIGGVLCDRSQEEGNTSTACSVGCKLRTAGIIVSAVMLVIGFLNLVAGA